MIMYTSVHSSKFKEHLKKVYTDFKNKHCYIKMTDSVFNKIYFKHNYINKPRYSSSFIDRIYKMKHRYINDIFVNSYDYIQEYDINGSYNSYFSYGSYNSYNSYSSYNSYNSYNSYYTSYNSYNSYGSYGSFANAYSLYNSFYACTYNNVSPFVNLGIYQDKRRNIYKNEYQYISCDIRQNFFVMGYGLELI